MADRPILFSAPMVRALLDGRKTMTRRVLKPQPVEVEGMNCRRLIFHNKGGREIGNASPDMYMGDCPAAIFAPYHVGDVLWVREGFVEGYELDENERPCSDRILWYRADGYAGLWYDPDKEETRDSPPWKSSIHMPRRASRLTLTVTGVKVERLQDISEADARAEGWAGPIDGRSDEANRDAVRDWFSDLWIDINGPGSWEANPWVCAVSFTVERRNIDARP